MFPLGVPVQKSNALYCVCAYNAPSLEEGLGDQESGAERGNLLQKKHPDFGTNSAVNTEMGNRLDQ